MPRRQGMCQEATAPQNQAGRWAPGLADGLWVATPLEAYAPLHPSDFGRGIYFRSLGGGTGRCRSLGPHLQPRRGRPPPWAPSGPFWSTLAKRPPWPLTGTYGGDPTTAQVLQAGSRPERDAWVVGMHSVLRAPSDPVNGPPLGWLMLGAFVGLLLFIFLVVQAAKHFGKRRGRR